ncbi:MAG: lytic transglycosylase domain-containing protein [Candidatus Kapaibacterium sp.]
MTSRRILLPIAASISLFVLPGCDRHRSDGAPASDEKNIVSYNAALSRVRLPSALTVFGEVVPLDDADVRERCERELYLNLQTPGQLILNIKRSGRYFALFSTLAKEYGVPDDVRYLAVAESALYMTRSQKDAVGLWQFLEGTARSYGLRVDDQVDERKHVEKSTRAALRYLKDAYRIFGSWTLAAASYNMGMEGVRSSLKTQHSTDYFSTYLNDETSRYVPRIAVIKELMQHGDRYGLFIPDERRYADTGVRTVTEAGSVSDLAAWAKGHGCSYKDVKLLNPWILGASLPHPRGRWEILLPEK